MSDTATTQSTRSFEFEVPVVVRVTVADEPVGDSPNDRMHPLDPRRMEGIYDLGTPAEILGHLAYNAIRNHCETASALDGWGDISVLPEEAADWPRWKRQFYVRDHHPVRMEITDVVSDEVTFFDLPPTTREVQGLSD